MDNPTTDETAAQASADALRKKANSRRASKACLKCRRRKVRCDVTRTGGPCTNCRLDSAHCEVVSRAPRKFECDLLPTSRVLLPATKTKTAGLSHDSDGRMRIETSDSNKGNDDSSPSQYDDLTHSPDEMRVDPAAASMKPISEEVNYASSSVSSAESHGFQVPDLNGATAIQDHEYNLTADPGWSNISPLCNSGMVEDRVFLEFRGCFMVPSQPSLNEFLDQYYLHVQPLLPVLGRDQDFGSLFDAHDAATRRHLTSTGYVSALLLQAVLFAASPYVSEDTLSSLGYSSMAIARQAFYERAKLLFDFDIELDHVTIAQAALLLTYWFPHPKSSEKQATNTSWLRTAISHARAAGADKASRAAVEGESSPAAIENCSRNDDVLRRLWWCCIARDRIMSLCIRRGLNINDENFDFHTQAPLQVDSLSHDIGASRVFDASARHALATLFVLFTELCLPMTDACGLIHPREEELRETSSSSTTDEVMTRCRVTRARLYKWSQTARERQASILDTAEFGKLAGSDGIKHVILHANLLWIYYHAAWIALDNYELQLAYRASVERPIATTTVRELCIASVSIINSLQRLTDLGVADRVPNSAVGCSALPFALHIMAVKQYQSLHRESGRFSKALKTSEDRLAVLMESMKELHEKYEGVEWISEVTLAALPGLADCQNDNQSAASRVPEEPNVFTVSGEESVDYLSDLITQNPLGYVRLSMTLDLGLRLHRMPHPKDFPQDLQQKLFPGKEDTYDTPLKVPVFPVSAPPPVVESQSERDQLLSDWAENDRSLFYLQEIGLAP